MIKKQKSLHLILKEAQSKEGFPLELENPKDTHPCLKM